MQAGARKLEVGAWRGSIWLTGILLALAQGFAQTPEKASPCGRARARAEQGRQRLAEGNAQGAIQELRAALSLCPENREAGLDLTKAYLASKEFALAEQTVRDFLSHQPSSEKGEYLLAYTYFSERRYQDARDVLQALLAQGRQNADALRLVGEIFFSVEDFDNAERFLLECLKIRPEDEEALEYLGGAYYFKREYTKAISTFRELLALRPTAYGAYDRLATCYAQMQDTDTAMRLFKEAQALSPRKAPPDDLPFAHMAQLLISFHREAEALPYAREAVRINPDSASNHYLLGNALFQQKDLKGALEHLRKAEEIDPSDPQAHYLLAKVYRELGRPDDAKREFAAFRELNQAKTAKPTPLAPAPNAADH